MGEKDEAKKGDDGGGKKDDGTKTVVLKLDLHCKGCSKKVKRAVSHFEGVVDVKADATSNKLTVTGSVDPTNLRDRVEGKTGKKVEILSPQTPAKTDSAGGGKGGDSKKAADKTAAKDGDKTEPKPVPLSTLVLKIPLHCNGCAQKIKRVINKMKGVDSVDMDEAKDLVTVKGTMEAKELVEYLKDKLKRNVEVVAPRGEEGGGKKKDKEVKKNEGGGEKEKQGGGEKKDKESGGDEKKEGGGGNDKKEGSSGEKKDGGGSDGKKGDTEKVEAKKMQHYEHPLYPYYNLPMQGQGYVHGGYNMPAYYNQGYNYDHGYSSRGYTTNEGYTTQVYANQSYMTPSYTHTYPNHDHVAEYSHQPQAMYYNAPPQGQYLPAPPPPTYVHAPQIFSDENPNACSVM